MHHAFGIAVKFLEISRKIAHFCENRKIIFRLNPNWAVLPTRSKLKDNPTELLMWFFLKQCTKRGRLEERRSVIFHISFSNFLSPALAKKDHVFEDFGKSILLQKTGTNSNINSIYRIST
jgi:hypothetical protein